MWGDYAVANVGTSVETIPGPFVRLSIALRAGDRDASTDRLAQGLRCHMGKIDEIRRQREAQIAQRQRQLRAEANGPTKSIVQSSPTPPPNAGSDAGRIAPRLPSRRDAPGGEGKCSGCGKVRAIQSGVIVNHQKGLGKICAGSRKEPLAK
jgi:hypothetical protein